MRLLTPLLLTCLLTAAAPQQVAAHDQGSPPLAEGSAEGTAAAPAIPAWQERRRSPLVEFIVSLLWGAPPDRREPAGTTSGAGEPRDPARQEAPATGADPIPILPCDRLAGAASDPYAVVDGVETHEIDPGEAVPACEEALRLFPGETRFAFQLGRALQAAEGYEEAARWYGVAAEAGWAVAMNNLGVLHRLGWGLPQSDQEAFYWFSRAAHAGEPNGMANLALLYREGKGVPQDDAQAVRWFREAANRGEPFAMRLLAAHFAYGRGVETDYREAARWYRQAARTGNVAAMHDLAWIYAGGLGLPEDQGEALRWYRAAAEGGYAPAKFQLARRYLEGRGLPQDEAEALRLLLEAAQGEVPEAMAALGLLYREGRGVERDEAAAAGWFRRSAEAGYADAMAEFAFLLDSGRGLAADPTGGADWLYRALRAGSYLALSRLRSGEGSEALRDVLLTRLRKEGLVDTDADDLATALEGLP